MLPELNLAATTNQLDRRGGGQSAQRLAQGGDKLVDALEDAEIVAELCADEALGRHVVEQRQQRPPGEATVLVRAAPEADIRTFDSNCDPQGADPQTNPLKP